MKFTVDNYGSGSYPRDVLREETNHLRHLDTMISNARVGVRHFSIRLTTAEPGSISADHVVALT